MASDNAVKHPRTEACLGGRKKKLGQVFGDLEILCRELEDESAHWKRMYECAQNANAYRQAALECGGDSHTTSEVQR